MGNSSRHSFIHYFHRLSEAGETHSVHNHTTEDNKYPVQNFGFLIIFFVVVHTYLSFVFLVFCSFPIILPSWSFSFSFSPLDVTQIHLGSQTQALLPPPHPHGTRLRFLSRDGLSYFFFLVDSRASN